jgi:membrane-associated phospholipid phosphatase
VTLALCFIAGLVVGFICACALFGWYRARSTAEPEPQSIQQFDWDRLGGPT